MIDFDTVDLDAPVDCGWVPRIGQRVRVTGAIAECQELWIGYVDGHPIGERGNNHQKEEVGRTGTVVNPRGLTLVDPSHPHRFAVLLDDCSGLPFSKGRDYSAHELEPIE